MRQWMRVLRPLRWWAILLLLLCAYRVQQRLSAQTRLTFSVALQGRSIGDEASVTLDGRRIISGQQLSIGSHRLLISHPKAEPWSTNLFIWYGPHDLGEIALSRGKGTLAIEASPPAALLTIRGPEFTLTLTNSAGVTTSVPTDRYVIEAIYRHGRQTQELSIFANLIASWRFLPRIGTLQATCNQEGASFQLLRADGQLVQDGELPATVRDVPEGTYNLVAMHHGNRREQMVAVGTGVTNTVSVEFLYGAAIVGSEPVGATVIGENGNSLGVTPLLVTDLRPGHVDFTLRREGYEPALVSFDATANETNHLRTTLVNSAYVRAINAAREYLKDGVYQRAVEASGEALLAKPDDPDAVAIQREATKQGSIAQAKTLAAKEYYDLSIKVLQAALMTLPEDEDLKQLLADYRKHEQDRTERLQQEQTSRARVMFDAIMAQNRDFTLFESHELKSSKPASEVKSAIMNALRNSQPPFVITDLKPSETDPFVLQARQEFPSGKRECLIVGGQTFPDETQILFKVLEYTTGQSVTVLGVLSVKSDMVYTPVHPSRVSQMTYALRAQLDDGVRIVTGLLQRAAE
jgi:tetratricopeptide (TPR) repeat protein